MAEAFLPDFITIPFPVYRDEELEGVDRVIYGIIYMYAHLENTKCFASNETLARQAGVQERTVRSALTRLEDRGYIARVYKDAGRRHRVEIEALISYKKGFVDGSLKPTRRRQNVGLDGSLEPHKNKVKNKVKKSAPQSGAEAKPTYSPLGAEIIEAFIGVDPKNEKYYGNTTQRSACDFLIEKYTIEKVLKVIELLPKTNKILYFPKIYTACQLRDSWQSLADAFQRKKAEGVPKKPVFM